MKKDTNFNETQQSHVHFSNQFTISMKLKNDRAAMSDMYVRKLRTQFKVMYLKVRYLKVRYFKVRYPKVPKYPSTWSTIWEVCSVGVLVHQTSKCQGRPLQDSLVCTNVMILSVQTWVSVSSFVAVATNKTIFASKNNNVLGLWEFNGLGLLLKWYPGF